MDKGELGDGLVVEECEAGVVIGDEVISSEMQQVVLSPEQAASLWTWLDGWMREHVNKEEPEDYLEAPGRAFDRYRFQKSPFFNKD